MRFTESSVGGVGQRHYPFARFAMPQWGGAACEPPACFPLMLELTVPPTEAGNRLDRFLAGALAHLSRSRVQALIRSGHVLLNRRIVKPGEALRPDDVISWEEPPVADVE